MKNGINQFTKAEVINLRNEINAALSSIEKKYGIKLNAGNASFSGNECTYKLKANTIGDGGTVITRESKNWDFYKNTSTRCGHLLTGYNTRAKKAPIQFKSIDGRNQYKCSINLLNMENSK